MRRSAPAVAVAVMLTAIAPATADERHGGLRPGSRHGDQGQPRPRHRMRGQAQAMR